jgi:hypothetical protein
MKKLLFSILCLAAFTGIFAQAPQAFKYQSIVRNSSGNPIANGNISVRATVHDGSAVGTIVYQETHAVTTNAFGLINLEIGNGTVVSGTFSAIAWGTGSKWMQIEADFGSGYVAMGTSQLLSVPYALNAGNNVAGPPGPMGPAGVIPSAQYVQLGVQPAAIAAGQPFTYSTAILTSTVITATTAVFNPPFTASGTVFTLANAGRYEINYQMTYPTNGGVVIYLGSTIAGMAPLAYSMIGKTPDGAVSGSVIVETTAPNFFLSINAAPGNATAISILPNSSTTNQTATTVSIKQIY